MRIRNGFVTPSMLLLLIVPAMGQEAKDAPKHVNRLAKETSPYLLLHSHNPVDWYPWGPEAFEKAKKEDKPIFLSVGYSSCYWCHVMERESFSSEEIAKTLNERFVCIKVDREERPDVDQVYMAALQALSGGAGGWPMSMFLAPDGRPFFGATYFPPRDRDDAEGFPTILERVYTAWRDHRKEIEADGDRLADVARRILAGSPLRRKRSPSKEMLIDGRAALAEQFDPDFGGFGYNPDKPKRPKFPEATNLLFLLDQHRRSPGRDPVDPRLKGPTPLHMVTFTLDHIARGGIRDQIGGGYHRYSVERSWNVPHFEKMLYDNAQLASVYSLAFEATKDDRWRREAVDTLAFVARSLTAPDGSFYSALDAETEGDEGAYYLWTRAQIKRVVKDDTDLFASVYGLDLVANFEHGRHVLFQPKALDDQAKALNISPAELHARLDPLKEQLLAARDKRPAPLRDEKVLTSWNGLMIAGYAEAYRVFKDDAYRKAAERAADFLLANHRKPDGGLLRTSRGGNKAKIDAYLEDYAFLAHGLLRLHEATGDPKRLLQAKELSDRMIADFSDEKDGGFFYTSVNQESLFARPKDPYDNAIPGANSLAITNLLAIASATGESRYRDLAGRALESFGQALTDNPAAAPVLLMGVAGYLDGPHPAAASPSSPPSDPLGLGDTRRVVAADVKVAKDAKAAPGGELDVVVSVSIRKGWHIYANPVEGETLRPTSITLAPGASASILKVEYPKGERQKLAGSSDPVSVYEGDVRLTARVSLPKDAKPGPMTLPLRLRYQACDARACLAPATVDLPVTIEVEAR